MLRLVNPTKSNPVMILETTFHLRSMTVREKFAMLNALTSLEATTEAYDKFIEHLCTAIIGIDGHDDVKEALNGLEHFEDLRAVIDGVTEYCSLKDSETKNSDSSSGGSTPSPVGKDQTEE